MITHQFGRGWIIPNLSIVLKKCLQVLGVVVNAINQVRLCCFFSSPPSGEGLNSCARLTTIGF